MDVDGDGNRRREDRADIPGASGDCGARGYDLIRLNVVVCAAEPEVGFLYKSSKSLKLRTGIALRYRGSAIAFCFQT